MAPLLLWSQTLTTVTLVVTEVPTFNGNELKCGNYSLTLSDDVDTNNININNNGLKPIITLPKMSLGNWPTLTNMPTDFYIKNDWDRWVDEDEDNGSDSGTDQMPGMPGMHGMHQSSQQSEQMQKLLQMQQEILNKKHEHDEEECDEAQN